jgi:dihydroflavonol-4-reductase
LKGLLDLLAQITGVRAPGMKIPHGVALAVAYVDTAFSRLMGKEPQIPVEGVKIARHKMFVDASRAQRELGFQPGPVVAALERAVRWYRANGYVTARRAKRIKLAA